MSHVHAARRLKVTPRHVARAAALLCASLALPYALPLMAATTEIDNEPLATRPTVKAKPNLMVVLDTSGSMAWNYMPDSMTEERACSSAWIGGRWVETCTSRYGFRAAQCNGVAYDPEITYAPPKKYDGTSYPDATYPTAKDDGYSGSSDTNLSGHYYYTYKGTQPKMGWVYTAARGDNPVDNDFRKECYSQEGSGPGATVFDKVNVSSLTTAQQTNYANWFSFYSKRYLLMRTAMGHAMTALDDTYRVGFSSIHESGFTDGGTRNFLGVNDFTGGSSGHKKKFYDSLYASTRSGATPLRQALANTGRYFAKKISGQVDPMQYSCQRNYALLTTDGYWNSENGTQLNGSSLIGQQDGLEARPMRDSATISDVVTTTYAVTEYQDKISTQTKTHTWSGTKTLVSNTPKPDTPNKGKYSKTVTPLTYTVTQTRTVITPQKRTFTRTVTVTTPEGGTPTTKTVDGAKPAWIDGTAGEPVLSPAEVTAPSDYSVFSPVSSTVTWVNGKGTGVATYSPTTPSAAPTINDLGTATSYSSGPAPTVVQVGDPTSSQIESDGTPNTLADVAEYYWKTDLRTPDLGNCTSNASGEAKDTCNNIVPTTTSDPATHQHMNTFGIGMGLSGTLPYDKNYLTQTSGSYVDLKNGTIDWPKPGFSEDGSGGYSGSSGGPTNIDDLWHASVNGRGQYYSAMDATSLSEAIAGVVASIQNVDGASSAAATSSLELIAGDDNRLYRASYTTGAWSGDITAYALAGSTATVSTTVVWSAQSLLNSKAYDTRNIYFNKDGALTAFNYDNLPTTQQTYFANLCSKTPAVAQCSTLSTSDKDKANEGDRLVNFLIGDRTHEAATGSGVTAVAALYRKREHVLGDIINGAPVYVGKPPFSYADAGYADFAATARTAMIYAAANDGMLHAFDAATGAEKWAYVPTAVMPNMYKLADRSYATRHQYFVDGAPVMGDIKVGDVWKTILVGGLNKGGKAYYALDITNPNSPKLLWEFTHANLGYSYGNPVITKNAAGTWVVAFASGYNNETGDGKGRLFIVNANTGEEIVSGGIPTSAGSTTTPSGLAKINAWVEDATNNTATRFYGGDLLGNIWRFDYDGLVEPKNSALKLGVAEVSSAPQPITTKPMLLQAGGKPVVIVGTGRYLGEGDIIDATQQSIYAIKDPLINSGWGTVRTNVNFVEQELTVDTDTGTTATVTNNAVDWSTKAGWWMDLPNAKERITTPMGLQLTTLVVPTTIPKGDACVSGGSSWLYFLNAATGSNIGDGPVGSEFSSNNLIAGTNWVRDSNGNIRLIVQTSDGKIATKKPPVTGSGGSGTAHRTSWRELID